jgi:hypothetical protein
MSLTRFVFVLAVVVASRDTIHGQASPRAPVAKDANGDPLPPGAYARLSVPDAGKNGSAVANRAFTLAFSDDGRRLLAGGLDSVLFYDVVDGKKLPLRLTLADGKGKVKDKQFACTLALSSDGKKAAAGVGGRQRRRLGDDRRQTSLGKTRSRGSCHIADVCTW